MEETGDMINSFIIRIWLEETITEGGPAIWRGHVTHISSQTRIYIQSLEDITAFIMTYLQQMGIDTT